METHWSPGKLTSAQSFKWTDGSVLNFTPKVMYFNLGLESMKTSVNTGKFIPGVYRVNPYTVYRETAKHVGKSPVTRAFVVGAIGSTTVTVELKGDIPLYANSACGDTFTHLTGDENNLMQRALLKAYNKIGSSQVGMGENLGEIRETLLMLKSPFKSFRDFFWNGNFKNLGLYNQLSMYARSGIWEGRKGKLSALDAAKTASNTWLEFRYGLMPLVYTVQDLIELVNMKMAKLDPDKIRTRRSLIGNWKNSSSSITKVVGNMQLDFTADSKWTQQYRACVQYRTTHTLTMSELLGLAPQYLPETVWELTRLSFVLDWWFDVGSWIESLRINPGVQILGNTVGVKTVRTVSSSVKARISGGTPCTPVNYGVIAEHTAEHYQRSCGLHLPTLPVVKLDFSSVLHAVDALSLILQPTLKHLRKNAQRS